MPHPLMQILIGQQKTISTFAAHADIGSFLHRIERGKDETGGRTMNVQYFQYAHHDDERKFHTLTLLDSYVMVLDVFADFLIDEQKVVAVSWKSHVHTLGGEIERRAKDLRVKVELLYSAEDGATPGVSEAHARQAY